MSWTAGQDICSLLLAAEPVTTDHLFEQTWFSLFTLSVMAFFFGPFSTIF
jgi:hypothetical protein